MFNRNVILKTLLITENLPKKKYIDLKKEAIEQSQNYKYEQRQERDKDQMLLDDLEIGFDTIRGSLDWNDKSGLDKFIHNEKQGEKLNIADPRKTNEDRRVNEDVLQDIDSYDQYVKEMLFDRRCQPGEGIKSEKQLLARKHLEKPGIDVRFKLQIHNDSITICCTHLLLATTT